MYLRPYSQVTMGLGPHRQKDRKIAYILHTLDIIHGLPWWLTGEESTCQAGDTGSIPGLERFHGEGNGNPCQYSCLESPIHILKLCIFESRTSRYTSQI